MSELDIEKFWRELQDPRNSPVGRAHVIAEAMRIVYGLEIDESRLVSREVR